MLHLAPRVSASKRFDADKTLQAGGFTAQPLAALPPYGCGVPLAGASAGHFYQTIPAGCQPCGAVLPWSMWALMAMFLKCSFCTSSISFSL